MANKDSDFVQRTIEILNIVARDNAVRTQGADEGFSVVIEADDIRRETNRQRIKPAVLTKIKKEFDSSGLEAEIDHEQKCISLFVPPLLAQKNNLKLSEISERASVISEINVREEFDLINNN
jgi:hypothetical protein